jgi:hypothetical protein
VLYVIFRSYDVIDKELILSDALSDNLLASLENRDVALWIRSFPTNANSLNTLTTFLGLPWRMVFMEVYDAGLISQLEAADSVSDQMTRRRGFLQIIDSDPSRIEMPQRCLPVYLLNGRNSAPGASDFDSRLRRMTMLEEMRRSGAREILVISGDEEPIPPDLRDIWSSGFRSFLTFVSDSKQAETSLRDWLGTTEGVSAINLLRIAPDQAIQDVVQRYAATYPESRRVVRMRDVRGAFHKIDITDVDEPERPILEHYSLIEDRDLVPRLPNEISEADFVGFFQNSQNSWLPYAAGLPWIRSDGFGKKLQSHIKKLDAMGASENVIAYIACEPGAGGTTLSRALAWECAKEGYPVLLAKAIPFLPDALPISNFLNRVHIKVNDQLAYEAAGSRAETASIEADDHQDEPAPRRYETPWIIVFDVIHWHYRESELVHFRKELEKSGRPVCVLVVTGTVLPRLFYNESVFKRIGELNHSLSQDDAMRLGRHLNKFLRIYGKHRDESQWDRFYQEHTVRYLEGAAAFWVTLSFWIQGQYDLTQSIQEWVYRFFTGSIEDPVVQHAILEIAALSSERLPIPEALLPSTKTKWPVSHLLEDLRSNLAALGLVSVTVDGKKYWALVHDVLGRLLINALFYDFQRRETLGFADAKDAEHLRFMLLRQISRKRALGDHEYRSIGEDFATSIFKVDPDSGRGSFASLWREVLDALDGMPQSLRDTSRVFRHHTAISRRRIAKLDETFYGVTRADRLALLNQAINDINYALNSIEYVPGSESDVNLFNSLANAYLNLADEESAQGAPLHRIAELREKANDATRRAYEESPTNSHVIETYVKNLLAGTREASDEAVARCIEALGILFSAIASKAAAYRTTSLADLAKQALTALLRNAPKESTAAEPVTPIEVLIQAWKILAREGNHQSGMIFSDVPEDNRKQALDALAHPAGRGNMQVIHLTYDLVCVTYPYSFKEQLDLLEQIVATDYRIKPQLRLEHAILLFQNSRAVEGDLKFRSLRQLWRESEHIVHVPERLRWLRSPDTQSLQVVHGVSGQDYGTRAMARVQEFRNIPVPFRPEEFGYRNMPQGLRFSSYATFGHNGPFLRPVTVHPAKGD